MKKLLLASLLSLSFVFVAHADVIVPQGNGNPLQVSQVWGQTGYETKTVPVGTVITDAAGQSYTCSARVDVQGCSVLVELAYYKNAMRSMYAVLVQLGLASQFPQFAYWGK